MARPVDLDLPARAKTAGEEDRASGALDVDDLSLGNLRANTWDSVGNLNVGIADFRGDKESAGGWEDRKARRKCEGL